MENLAAITPEQQEAINTIMELTRDFMAYMLPILPHLMGIVLVVGLLYKFTLGAVKKI